MTNDEWDVLFAIRISELNARLEEEFAETVIKQSLTAEVSPSLSVKATPSNIRIVEVPINTSRSPGPRPVLTVELDLASTEISGSKVSEITSGGGPFTFSAITIQFSVTLQYVKTTDVGDSLKFAELPPNTPGIPVVTAVVESCQPPIAIEGGGKALLDIALEGWLRQHLEILSPVLILFGSGGWSLGQLDYVYVQSMVIDEDFLVVSAMLADSSSPVPTSPLLIPDFIDDGTSAILLSTGALLKTALLPALNAYAKALDPQTYAQLSGKIFKYDDAVKSLALADGLQGGSVKLQSGTVQNESYVSPLFIDQIGLHYGNFGGKDALQLTVQQSAVLQTGHTYSNFHSGTVRTEVVPWCSVHRKQTNILDVSVGPSAKGDPVINLTPRGGADATDESWSEAVPGGTGNPIANGIIGFFENALQSTLMFLGPPGLALFLFELAITTITQEIDLVNIQNAKDRTVPISPSAIAASINFQWGGIGYVNYKSAKLDGGLKIIGV